MHDFDNLLFIFFSHSFPPPSRFDNTLNVPRYPIVIYL